MKMKKQQLMIVGIIISQSKLTKCQVKLGLNKFLQESTLPHQDG